MFIVCATVKYEVEERFFEEMDIEKSQAYLTNCRKNAYVFHSLENAQDIAMFINKYSGNVVTNAKVVSLATA